MTRERSPAGLPADMRTTVEQNMDYSMVER
jgi:hypothetical protein